MSAPRSARWGPAALALLVALAALAPRLSGLDTVITIDEAYHWITRVERFSAALARGDWAATNQTGHPGVTTMWLGALGLRLAAALGVENPGLAGGPLSYLALLRLPLALVNGLAPALGYLVLRRLLAPAEALAGALLWAGAPFLVAFGQLLHLDGLLTSFCALALLCALAATQDAGRTGRRWLAASGAAAGLALLTKAPALLLLPSVGLLLLAHAWRGRAAGWRPALLGLTAGYALWLGCALALAAALWPAVWVGPAAAAGSVLREIVDNGGQPHHSGNFFMGQALADPGGLFYLAVLALRATPLLLGGLAALALLALRGRRAGGWALLGLLGFALLFGLLMTLQAKKLDRYLLPIWPALCALAGAGLARAAEALLRGRARLPAALALSAALLDGGLALGMSRPYPLSYYNPLAGGGPAAQRTILVGIGEGMDEVGAWLRARPDLGRGDVLSWIPPTLMPHVPRTTQVLDLRPALLGRRISYAVLYVRSVQHQESPEAEAAVRASPPLHTVTVNGIRYATIHQLPWPYATPSQARFGDTIALHGYTIAERDGALEVSPSWGVLADRPGGLMAFVHVLDAQGRRVAQIDIPLDEGMFATWQAGQQFGPTMPLALPPGLTDYRIALGVYDPASGARLALGGAEALPEALAGPQVLELRR